MIDTHSHYYGEALFRRLEERRDVPRVARDGTRRFMVTPTSRFELRGGFTTLADRLGWMDSQGIDRQVITFPGALGPDVLPAAEALPLVRDVNDELAAVCAAHSGRFTALAGLPLADIDLSVVELERACTSLGLRGAIIPSNYFCSLAVMRRLHPVLDAASRLGAHLMVHPGQRHDEPLAPHLYDDLGMHRASTIDLHNGISHATTTLIHAGLSEHWPGASVQIVNLGGAFPFLVERMDHISAIRAPGAPLPSTLLGGLVFDTASLGPRAIEMAVAILGPERIMLGTDYPIFDTRVATEAVAAARIDRAARDAIAFGNAARLFGPNA
ncbi:amidohydrolase family protein [Humitalea sp. 24SJ18S-53]|uniref:amidohydrolase family protein n=1 Tax=Humitalea sp. 24SJ18S-53 TaxID=3422307 RepID=UPI003D6773A0